MTRPVIILSCVDAGSANCFIPILQSKALLSHFNINVYATGIAAKKFTNAGIVFHFIKEIDQQSLVSFLEIEFDQIEPDLLLCGTSWGMTVDKIMTRIAINREILSVSIIDHWTLFRQRYSDINSLHSSGEFSYLTDYCIVIDERASFLAEKAGIDRSRLLIGGQPHLEMIWSDRYEDIQGFNNGNRKAKILFVSEQIRDDIGCLYDLQYDEYSVLDDLYQLSKRNHLALDIKLHPQEHIEKYLELGLNKCTVSRITKEISFETMINDYEFIVGMDSMLLIEIGLFRSNVISYRPGFYGDYHLHDTVHSIFEVNDISSLEKYLLSSECNYGLLYKKSSNQFEGSLKRIINIINRLVEVK